MRTRINCSLALTLLVVFSGSAHAARELKVARSMIYVSSPSAGGRVVVWGSSGAVHGSSPLSVKIYNKSKRLMMGGVVAEDGSFAVALPASDGDTLKVKFIANNRRTKSIRLKVPEGALPAAPEALAVVEEMEVPVVPEGEEAAEEAASVEEVLAPRPAEEAEPVISAAEETAQKGPLPSAEGEPLVPETPAPPPTIEERLMETGDLEAESIAAEELQVLGDEPGAVEKAEAEEVSALPLPEVAEPEAVPDQRVVAEGEASVEVEPPLPDEAEVKEEPPAPEAEVSETAPPPAAEAALSAGGGETPDIGAEEAEEPAAPAPLVSSPEATPTVVEEETAAPE